MKPGQDSQHDAPSDVIAAAKAHVTQIAERVVEGLLRGGDPWRCVPGAVPYNPVTGRPYAAFNRLALLTHRRDDPRWMTAGQARELGGAVRKGEPGVVVHHWEFDEARAGRSSGRAALIAPRLYTAVVYNAEQCEGPLAAGLRPSLDAVDPQQLLARSGARVTASDRSHFDQSSDVLFVKARAEHASGAEYDATILRGLAHWTNHPTRLPRARGPVGSREYVQDQLTVALFAELVLGCKLQHTQAQREAWVALLREQPQALLRTTGDAERIRGYIVGAERSLAQAVRVAPAPELAPTRELPMLDRHYVAVPYRETAELHALARAYWDKERRVWYVHAKDRDRVARWEPTESDFRTARQEPELAFRAVLVELGFELTSRHPILDGRRHRCAVVGDARGARSGSYRYDPGPYPEGVAHNFRTGKSGGWRQHFEAKDGRDSAAVRCIVARMAHAGAVREERQRQQELAVARQIRERLRSVLTPVTEGDTTDYLTRKGVSAAAGIYTNSAGETVIPGYDVDGRVWTLQTVANGYKKFEYESRTQGTFHVLGGYGLLSTAWLVVLAEGYATAASVAEGARHAGSADGVAVVAGFNAANLTHVAKALKQRFPSASILVAGDDDRALEIRKGMNPGRAHAREAAAAVRGQAVFPVFPRDASGDATDFNDLAVGVKGGQQLVANQIGAAIRLVWGAKLSLEPRSHAPRRAMPTLASGRGR